MPYIGNVLTSFAVETGNINDQAITSPKLSATGGTDGQVLALDSNGDLVWSSNLDLQDNDKILVGTGDDLEIYHSGDHSFITDTGTGNLRIQGSNLRLQNSAGTADYLSANDGAAVSISHNNAVKLATTSTGIDVTGTVVADGLTVDTDVLHVDATNDRVGVGTASPSTELHLKTSGATGPTIRLEGTAPLAADSLLGGVDFFNNDGSGFGPQVGAFVRANAVGSGGDGGYLAFGTNDAATGSEGADATEKMRIDSSGRLLVGTGTANDADGQSNLIIESNSSGATSYGGLMLRRGSTTIGAGSSLGRIFFADQDGNIGARISGLGDGDWATDDYPAHLLLETTSDGAAAPTERVRIRENLFRIGTSSSSAGTDGTSQLQLVDATNNVEFILRGTSPRIIYDITGTNEAELYYDNRSFVIHRGTPASSGPEVMRLDSSGRLLVGTSSSVGPDNFLQLVGDVNDEATITCWRSSDDAGSGGLNFIKTRNTVASPNAADDEDSLGIIRWHAHDGSTWDGRAAQIETRVDGAVAAGETPGRLVFATNNGNSGATPTERLRINSNGIIELRNNQGSAQTNIIRFTDTDTSVAGDQVLGQLQWFSSDVSGGGACVKAEIAAVCDDTTPDVRLEIKTHSGSGTDPIESVRITSDGNIQLRRSGTGIDFAASQGAPDAGTSQGEVLDAYEEGAWTPVLVGSDTDGSYGYDNARTGGLYVRVGRLVHLQGAMRVTSTTTAATGSAFIGGVPFTPATQASSYNRTAAGILRVQPSSGSITMSDGAAFAFLEGSNRLGMGVQTTTGWSNISVTDADDHNLIWFFSVSYETSDT